MTKDEVLKRILQTNIRIENLFRDIFTKLFGYDPEPREQLLLTDWMRFQEAWCNSDAYSYAHDALQKMREEGYDVKMNMQSYKLSYHGLIKGE